MQIPWLTCFTDLTFFSKNVLCIRRKNFFTPHILSQMLLTQRISKLLLANQRISLLYLRVRCFQVLMQLRWESNETLWFYMTYLTLSFGLLYLCSSLKGLQSQTSPGEVPGTARGCRYYRYMG